MTESWKRFEQWVEETLYSMPPLVSLRRFRRWRKIAFILLPFSIVLWLGSSFKVIEADVGGPTGTDWLLVLCSVPFIVNLLAVIVLVIIQERIWRTRCERCNYDLRGSDGDRCPECGEMRRDSTKA